MTASPPFSLTASAPFSLNASHPFSLTASRPFSLTASHPVHAEPVEAPRRARTGLRLAQSERRGA
ncbi:MAG: hypothetical protein EOO26_13165 [Comamonadaceae bacterium]|nr:MAG: hypothetical protein EOO26_13165 [Comamonadaceae bacterium]